MNHKIPKLLSDLNDQLSFINLEIDNEFIRCERTVEVILKTIETLKIVISNSPNIRFLWNNIMPVLTLLKKNVHTPSQAGKNLANLAYSKKYKDLKGIYFSDGKVVKTSIDSYNKDYQKELWNGSLKLINMEFTEIL